MEKYPSAIEIFYQLFVKSESNKQSASDEAFLGQQMWNNRPMERAYAQELSLKIREKALEKKKRDKQSGQSQS